MDREQRRLDRLLSGSPDLSVQEKEGMLSQVLAPQRAPSVLRAPWVWASAVTAAIAIMVVPIVLRNRDGHEFGARGGGMLHGSFRVACNGVASSCRSGDTMTFDLAPPEGALYFAAAALRNDGLLVWYFPDDSGASLRADSAGVAARGVVIGDEQTAGSYRVMAAFTATPVSRDEMKRAIEGGPTTMHLVSEPLEVTER